MRQLPVLTAAFFIAATPAFAQVTVDLHALQALPEHPGTARTARPANEPPAPAVTMRTPAGAATRIPTPPAAETDAAAAVSRPAHSPPLTSPSAAPGTLGPTPAPPAAQPAMPETIPDLATIAPIAPPAPPSAAPPPPPVSTTAATTAAPTTSGLRLTFAPGQSDLSPDSNTSIKQLTTAAPAGDSTTFNVLAYAPGKPDDPSTARRISLSRAMAVRSALVADGVPSARIFVRALGEQYGDGPPDRVDVSVAGGTTPTDTANSR